MEEKIDWQAPDEIAFLDVVNTIKSLMVMQLNIDTERLDIMVCCSPIIRQMGVVLDELLNLAAATLGFDRRTLCGRLYYVKGDKVKDNRISICKDDFLDMIYRCRYDTEMLHCIYAAFAKYDRSAVAALAPYFNFEV